MRLIELDPATWDRGCDLRSDSAFLAGPNGMCCMGFAARAFGAATHDIAGIKTWRSLDATVPELSAYDTIPEETDERFVNVYVANDSANYPTDESRIAAINAELACLGEDFRFVLKPTTPTT